MTKLFRNKYVRYATMAVIILGALGIIIEPDIYIVKYSSRFAIHIMFSYLALGLLFFALDLKRLMFTSMLACAVLCLYLMSSTNASLKFDIQNQETQFTIAHFAVSNFDHSIEQTIDQILDTDADLVSIQEVTPDWARLFDTSLVTVYPFTLKIVRIDPYGQYILSKYPLFNSDTIFYREIPHLKTDVKVENHQLSVMSTYTLPPLDRVSYEQMNAQMDLVAKQVKAISHPVMVLGEFNIPPWTKDIIDFKYETALKDSRRGSIPTSLRSTLAGEGVPMDHIFYTRDMECINFVPLVNSESKSIGISGTYQFIRKRVNKQREG